MVTRIVIGIKVYTCTAYRVSQVRSFRCEQFCTGTVPYFFDGCASRALRKLGDR